MRILILALVCLLSACGPDAAGPSATCEDAAIVVMGQRVADDDVTVEAYPACMGIAVGPTLILTSDHCEPASVDGRYVIVTARQWRTTTNASSFADSALVVGEARTLVPRVPLLNWVTPDRATDGPAEMVTVRGTDIVSLPVTVTGLELSGAMQERGDSGAAICRDNRPLGVVTACNSSNDKDCDLPGGRMAGVP